MGELKATSAKTFKLFTLICLILLLYSMFSALVKADPVNVSWYVTDVSGVPIDEAALTIYWSTSTGGPFTIMPVDDELGNYVLDRIPEPDVKQNPIYTGYWNPDHPNGMAVCDIHPIKGVAGYYFYVEIQYDSNVDYWPMEYSYKPGDSTWHPVEASTPSGYAAAGPGIGNGPTTAYPTQPPPTQVIPEVPLGPALAAVSMTVAIGAYIGMRKRKTPYIS